MFWRGIALSVVVLLLNASGVRAQILTFTPSPELAASRNLWVTVVASAAGSVNVNIRDSEARLAEPQMFNFVEPGEETRKIGLNRIPKLPVSVEFQSKPASPTTAGMVRSMGASLQPYRRPGPGATQKETALTASIAEPVECNGMTCKMCYTLQAESNVQADSLRSPARTVTYGAFARGTNKAPNLPHYVQWNQDEPGGSHVTGNHFIQLTTTNASGITKVDSGAFAVPGNPPVPSPGSRCPNP